MSATDRNDPARDEAFRRYPASTVQRAIFIAGADWGIESQVAVDADRQVDAIRRRVSGYLDAVDGYRKSRVAANLANDILNIIDAQEEGDPHDSEA